MSSKKTRSKKSPSENKTVIRDLQPKQDLKGGVLQAVVDVHIDDLTPRWELAMAYDLNGSVPTQLGQ